MLRRRPLRVPQLSPFAARREAAAGNPGAASCFRQTSNGYLNFPSGQPRYTMQLLRAPASAEPASQRALSAS